VASTLRIIIINALVVVVVHYRQGLFCVLIPKTETTTKIANVGLVRKTKTKIIIAVGNNFFLGRSPRECVPKLRRAHLRVAPQHRITDKPRGICCLKGFLRQEVP